MRSMHWAESPRRSAPFIARVNCKPNRVGQTDERNTLGHSASPVLQGHFSRRKGEGGVLFTIIPWGPNTAV